MFKFNFLAENEEKLNDKNDFIELIDHSKNQKSDQEQVPKIEQEKQVYGILNFEDLEKSRNDDIKNKRNIIFKKLDLILKTNEQDEKNDSVSDQVLLYYVDSIKLKIDENDSLAKINKTHDLVPGKYEGGLKVWELSIDLARFIYNINMINLTNGLELKFNKDIITNFESIRLFFKRFTDQKSNKRVLRVLELGCGHALPVLSVCKLLDDLMYKEYLKDKSKKLEEIEVIVYLQDFNQQIVQDITYENVKKYIETQKSFWKSFSEHSESPIKITPRFVYGDWKDLHDNDVLPKDYINLLLTSETIYNSENYKHLLNLFQKCLAKKNDESLVLLSAKTYYFGCGGNLHEFLQLCNSKYYKFQTSTNLLFDDDFYSEESKDKLDENKETSTIGKEIIKINFNE